MAIVSFKLTKTLTHALIFATQEKIKTMYSTSRQKHSKRQKLHTQTFNLHSHCSTALSSTHLHILWTAAWFGLQPKQHTFHFYFTDTNKGNITNAVGVLAILLNCRWSIGQKLVFRVRIQFLLHLCHNIYFVVGRFYQSLVR